MRFQVTHIIWNVRIHQKSGVSSLVASCFCQVTTTSRRPFIRTALFLFINAQNRWRPLTLYKRDELLKIYCENEPNPFRPAVHSWCVVYWRHRVCRVSCDGLDSLNFGIWDSIVSQFIRSHYPSVLGIFLAISWWPQSPQGFGMLHLQSTQEWVIKSLSLSLIASPGPGCMVRHMIMIMPDRRLLFPIGSFSIS